MEKKRNLNLAYGLLCLSLGGIWLADTIGALPWQMSEYIFSWRFLLVVIGVFIIVKDSRSVFGILVLATGLVSTTTYFWDLPEGWEDFLPPVALMVVGLVLLLRPNRVKMPKLDTSDDNVLNRATVFGSYNNKVTSVLFKGGYLTSVFGSNHIDLSKAHLGKDEVVMQCTSVFGSTLLIVPESWEIKLETTNVLGSTEDKRFITDRVIEKEGTLIVSGLSLFGSLVVKE